MERGGEGEKDPELELLEEGRGGDFMLDNDNTKSQCATNNHTYGLPPHDVDLPQPTRGSPPDRESQSLARVQQKVGTETPLLSGMLSLLFQHRRMLLVTPLSLI